MTAVLEAEFVLFLHELADAAGAIALRYFRAALPVGEKDDRSPVTEADRRIELRLRNMIMSHYPQHGTIGEEFGSHQSQAAFVWVIDHYHRSG